MMKDLARILLQTILRAISVLTGACLFTFTGLIIMTSILIGFGGFISFLFINSSSSCVMDHYMAIPSSVPSRLISIQLSLMITVIIIIIIIPIIIIIIIMSLV